jgi:hypothetical protein
MADPVEMATLHMATGDPARMPSFTPFAQGDYFLNASSSTTCGVSLDACLFIPAPSSFTFAWNHGGIQPEIATTWVGIVGPGVQNLGEDHGVWTDHTDLRPTILALTGLKDTYVSDGRVVTEVLDAKAVAKAIKDNQAALEGLGAAWKQVNAPFGSFAQDTLIASTRALASDAAGDQVYAGIEADIADLTATRNQLAGEIRIALFNAEFNGQKIKDKQANAWIQEANTLLDAAHALAAGS